MTGLYIVNYRHSASEPLKSITRLPFDEASLVAKGLYQNSACPAHRRFGPDFPSYYQFRLQIEQWLCDSFVRLGGCPQTRHPNYFALQSCQGLRRNFDDPRALYIPLDGIDPRHVSFTLGDSMAQQERNDVQPVFTMQVLYDRIERAGGADAFLQSVLPAYYMVEAQLWDDTYLDRAVNSAQ